jgi:hypothetical protein
MNFEDGAAYKVGDEVVAGRQGDALIDGQQDVEAPELFGVVDGINIFEMENSLTTVILA